MRDAYMPLTTNGTAATAPAVGMVVTATGTGVALDLLKGTNVEKDNRPGTDLLGGYGLSNKISAVIDVSATGGTTPQVVLTLNQSDDNTTFVAVSSVTVTANGEYRIPFRVTKRYVRLDTTVTGTTPTFTIDAFVGTEPF